MDLVPYQQFLIDAGAADIAAVAATGPLWKASLNLGLEGPLYDGTDTHADLTAHLANYTGYALGLITWGGATLSTDGHVEYRGTVPEFRPSDNVVPNVIKGCWIENFAVTAVYFAGAFDGDGIPMSGPLSALTVEIRYRPDDKSITVIIS